MLIRICLCLACKDNKALSGFDFPLFILPLFIPSPSWGCASNPWGHGCMMERNWTTTAKKLLLCLLNVLRCGLTCHGVEHQNLITNFLNNILLSTGQYRGWEGAVGSKVSIIDSFIYLLSSASSSFQHINRFFITCRQIWTFILPTLPLTWETCFSFS